MNTWQVEVTDTFGGQANYSWVRRHTFEIPDDATRLQMVRKAKALVGWNGVRCHTTNYGDLIELRPYGACMVAFICLQYRG